MVLREALDFVDTGYKQISLSDKNGKEYYYHDVVELKLDKQYKELSELEVINVDADGCDDTVVFYLW